MWRAFAYFFALWLGTAGSAAPSDAVIEVTARPDPASSRRLIIEPPADHALASGSRLLSMAGVRPEAWGELAAEALGSAVFEFADEGWKGGAAAARRLWLVTPNVVAELLDRWPEGAVLEAELDSLGPGERSAWLRAGTNQGIHAGECWWLRVRGQPAARCDVRFAGPDECFCAVVALAGAAPLHAGMRLALWPTPAETKEGRASTAVAFVERRSNDTLVWVAAPVDVLCPSETHLDFFRQGRYLGYGLVERRDDRFWYARFSPAAADPALATSRSAEGIAADTERAGARMESSATAVPRVGDAVGIRTRADIAARRFVARVFEVTPGGALVNAGEGEGLQAGQRATVLRGGAEVGAVTVRRAQDSYAEVERVRDPNSAVLYSPRIGDELRFGTRSAARQRIGMIESVTSETLFTARLAEPAAPVLVPLAVVSHGRTVGVAVLVATEAGRAGGFALSCALTQPLAAGMELELPSAADSAVGSTSQPAARAE